MLLAKINLEGSLLAYTISGATTYTGETDLNRLVNRLKEAGYFVHVQNEQLSLCKTTANIKGFKLQEELTAFCEMLTPAMRQRLYVVGDRFQSYDKTASTLDSIKEANRLWRTWINAKLHAGVYSVEQ